MRINKAILSLNIHGKHEFIYSLPDELPENLSQDEILSMLHELGMETFVFNYDRWIVKDHKSTHTIYAKSFVQSTKTEPQSLVQGVPFSTQWVFYSNMNKEFQEYRFTKSASRGVSAENDNSKKSSAEVGASATVKVTDELVSASATVESKFTEAKAELQKEANNKASESQGEEIIKFQPNSVTALYLQWTAAIQKSKLKYGFSFQDVTYPTSFAPGSGDTLSDENWPKVVKRVPFKLLPSFLAAFKASDQALDKNELKDVEKRVADRIAENK